MSVYSFSSPTCEPCRVLKPVIEDLKEEFSDLQWITVNIKDDPEKYCLKYDVTVVPTIVVDYGKIEKHSGTTVAGYYRILKNASRN